MKKLVLSKEIYSATNIQKAKTAYSKLAGIHVLPGKNNWLLLFLYCHYDEEQTIKEFENYLIGLENVK